MKTMYLIFLFISLMCCILYLMNEYGLFYGTKGDIRKVELKIIKVQLTQDNLRRDLDDLNEYVRVRQ